MNLPEPHTIPDFDPQRFFASLFETSKLVLLNPRYFFEGMKRQGGIRNPFIFMASCVVAHTLAAAVILGNPKMITHNLIFGLIFPLFTAGLLFLIINRLFKAPGTYEMAFRANAYAGAVALFSWIPLIGMVLEFYRLYLIGVGLSCAFSIKGSKAFLAILLTLIVYIIASGAFAHLTGTGLPVAPG
jgi:hypothetical protein